MLEANDGFQHTGSFKRSLVRLVQAAQVRVDQVAQKRQTYHESLIWRSLVRLVQAAQVRADQVAQPVLSAAAVAGVVADQAGDAAQAEDAVGDQHGALVAVVQVGHDVLGARDDDAHVGVHLHGTHAKPGSHGNAFGQLLAMPCCLSQPGPCSTSWVELSA